MLNAVKGLMKPKPKYELVVVDASKPAKYRSTKGLARWVLDEALVHSPKGMRYYQPSPGGFNKNDANCESLKGAILRTLKQDKKYKNLSLYFIYIKRNQVGFFRKI